MLRVRILAFLGKTLWKLGKWEEAGVLFGKLDRHLKVERMLKNQEGEQLIESLEVVWVGLGKEAFRKGEGDKVRELGRRAEEVIRKIEGGGGGEGRVGKIYRVYFKCLLYAALLDDREDLDLKLTSLLTMASEKLPNKEKFLLKVSQLLKKVSSPFLPKNLHAMQAKSPIHKISPAQSPKKNRGSDFPQKELNFKSKLYEVRKFSEPYSLPHPLLLLPSSSLSPPSLLPLSSLPPPSLLPPSSTFFLLSSSGVMLSKRPTLTLPPPSSLPPPLLSRAGRSPKNSVLNSSNRQNSQIDSDIMERSMHLSLRRGNERNSLKTVFRLDEEEEEEEERGVHVEKEEMNNQVEERGGRDEEAIKRNNCALKIQSLWRSGRMKNKRVAVELEKDNLLTYKLTSRVSMFNFGIEKRVDLVEEEVDVKLPIREIRKEDVEKLAFNEIEIPGGIKVKGVEVIVGGERREEGGGKKEEEEGGGEREEIGGRRTFGYKVHLQIGTERFDIFGRLLTDLIISNKCKCIWFLINRIMEEGFGKEEGEANQIKVESEEELEGEGKEENGSLQGIYSEFGEKQALSFITHVTAINKRCFYNKNRIVGSSRRQTEDLSLNFHRNYLHETKKAFWTQRKILIRTITTLSKLF